LPALLLRPRLLPAVAQLCLNKACHEHSADGNWPEITPTGIRALQACIGRGAIRIAK